MVPARYTFTYTLLSLYWRCSHIGSGKVGRFLENRLIIFRWRCTMSIFPLCFWETILLKCQKLWNWRALYAASVLAGVSVNKSLLSDNQMDQSVVKERICCDCLKCFRVSKLDWTSTNNMLTDDIVERTNDSYLRKSKESKTAAKGGWFSEEVKIDDLIERKVGKVKIIRNLSTTWRRCNYIERWDVGQTFEINLRDRPAYNIYLFRYKPFK